MGMPLGIVYDMSYTCDMCRAVRNAYKHNLSEHIECTQQPVSAAIYQPHRSAVFAVLFSLLHHKIAVHHQTSNRNKKRHLRIQRKAVTVTPSEI